MAMEDKTAQYHVQRIFDRLGDEGVKRAFNVLIDELQAQTKFDLEASSRGAYSAINVRHNHDRCYAFRGTKSWIAWYFRKPAFQQRLIDRSGVLQHFAELAPFESVGAGEIWVKIKNPADAHRVVEFIL